ncbi:hypothetical protein, partial [Streptomyces hygroscopicus]|uniref:hypothetical protein n=1 Tax=Streptomyces hygroscopicus TaxID=1912 RepID=UPI003F4D6DA8
MTRGPLVPPRRFAGAAALARSEPVTAPAAGVRAWSAMRTSRMRRTGADGCPPGPGQARAGAKARGPRPEA